MHLHVRDITTPPSCIYTCEIIPHPHRASTRARYYHTPIMHLHVRDITTPPSCIYTCEILPHPHRASTRARYYHTPNRASTRVRYIITPSPHASTRVHLILLCVCLRLKGVTISSSLCVPFHSSLLINLEYMIF